MISQAMMEYWRELQEELPDVTILREGRVKCKKPRHLNCGGEAEPGWMIYQVIGIEDGEFFVEEHCQICDWSQHGYEAEPDMNWPRHGNVPERQS